MEICATSYVVFPKLYSHAVTPKVAAMSENHSRVEDTGISLRVSQGFSLACPPFPDCVVLSEPPSRESLLFTSQALLTPFKGKQAEGILLTVTLSSAPTQCHLHTGFHAEKRACVRLSSQSGVRLKVMHKQLMTLTLHPACFSFNIQPRTINDRRV